MDVRMTNGLARRRAIVHSDVETGWRVLRPDQVPHLLKQAPDVNDFGLAEIRDGLHMATRNDEGMSLGNRECVEERESRFALSLDPLRREGAKGTKA
jgi:hypothetical protein